MFDSDRLLIELITAVEAGGTSLTLTLLVGGTVVTGHVVSRQEWIDTTRRRLQVLPPPAKMTAEQVLATIEAMTPTSPPGLVHLGDAEVDGRAIGLLRVPLTAITGVCLK